MIPRKKIYGPWHNTLSIVISQAPISRYELYEIVNSIKGSPLVMPPETDLKIKELPSEMLRIGPSKRPGMRHLRPNSLIASVDNLATDLPDVPLPLLRTESLKKD
jgi:hypothetical protein